MRGYFGIGIENPKKEINVGTLWRSAFSFGANFIFTIGKQYKNQSSDTTTAWRHIPLFHYQDFNYFWRAIPQDCKLVGIETLEEAKLIKNFVHPERVIYLLGNEMVGLSQEAIKNCDLIIKLPGQYCLNVATCGSIILYDRLNKQE